MSLHETGLGWVPSLRSQLLLSSKEQPGRMRWVSATAHSETRASAPRLPGRHEVMCTHRCTHTPHTQCTCRLVCVHTQVVPSLYHHFSQMRQATGSLEE